MWSRTMMLPLTVLIGAGIADGAVLGGTRFAGWSLSAWLVVGGLTALVIAALVDQAHAAIAEIEGVGELLPAVDKQNTLLAAGLVIAGLAVLLGAFAPRGGLGFATWAGLALAAMGIMLAAFKSVVGRRRTLREPSSTGVPGDQIAGHRSI